MTDIETLFNEARKAYPGTKRGFQVEWQNFRRKYKMNIFNHIHHLLPAINQQMAYREACDKADMWCADWKHFQTWINNQCWTEEQPRIGKRTKCFFCKQEKDNMKEISVPIKTCLVKICEQCLRDGLHKKL